MDWLNQAQAQAILSQCATPPQTLVLFADVARLAREIATAPTLVATSNGAPSPTHEWYCRTHSRVVVVQLELYHGETAPDSVQLLTPFVEQQSDLYDWQILENLEGLPDCIHVARPYFIESRTVFGQHVVYRSDPRGWLDTVYQAGSRAEGEKLLDYLRKDHWNESCHIADPEPAGIWTVITEGARTHALATYPSRSSALKLAWSRSLQRANEPLLVLSSSEEGEEVRYRVVNGSIGKTR